MEINLQKDGIQLYPEVYNLDTMKKVNDELDFLMNKPSINGSSGYVHLSRGYKTLQLPTIMIRSVNLLEIAIDIKLKIDDCEKYRNKNYVITTIEIFEETNKKPLVWHTDQREGMLRSFLYLEGGDEDSGAFTYMLGTQNDTYNFHKLSKSQIEENSSNIFIAKAPIGSLLIADTNGFHSNQPRKKRRRLVMFEFQPKESTFVKSSVFISSFQLSNKVKNNLNLFDNGVDPLAFSHGADRTLGGPIRPASNKIILYSIKVKIKGFLELVYNKLVRLFLKN